MKRLLCVFCLLAACLALVCCTEDRTGGGEPLPAPAPENLTAQEGDGQVALRWTEPVSDGLLEYDVRWNPGGGQRTMHVGFNYLVVDGLANGTEYAFSVTAVYADGRRSDSVSVKAVPHVGPWPEEGVNGTYINNGIVQLGVDMDRGGAVFHFSEVNTKRNLLNHADEGRIKLLRKIWTAELFALPPFFPLPTVIRRLARAGRPFGCSGGGESAGHTETYSTGNSYGRCRKGKAGNARASSQKRTGRSRSVDISDRKIFRRGVYSIVSSTSPSSTESPVATLISLTVPSRSESMLFSIFIASRIISRWPVPTRSPTAT